MLKRFIVVLVILSAICFGRCWALFQSFPQSEDWLKTYSVSPYSAYWSLTLEVKDLDKDLPRLLELLKKEKAELTEPFSNFAASRIQKVQQLSAKVPPKTIGALLKKIRKLGAPSLLIQRPNEDRGRLSEVQRKIQMLKKEKSEHQEDLAQMPAISALTDQVLADLLAAQSLYVKPDVPILLNLTVVEKK